MRVVWPQALGFAIAIATSGCATERPEVKAALTANLPALEQEIGRAEQGGPLPTPHLRQLARAVAEREITAAQGAEGARQVALFRPCLPALEVALDERAARGDDAAAVATLLLFEAGRRDGAELVQRYRDAESAPFRALAARAALRRTDAGLRRLYFQDPDERVRGAAFEAAVKAPIAEELPELIEAAHLDPSAQNRARAAQAAGRIGSESAVLGLLDVFAGGDEQARLSVLDAWSEPQSFQHGGERELSRALGSGGLISVSAAGLLLGSRESRLAALAVLNHAITDGSDDERRAAMMTAPLEEPSVKEALEKAAKAPPPELAPLLLGRLATLPGAGAQARAKLEQLATDKGEHGLAASYELAQLGSLRAITRLEQELGSPRASRRLRAALTLASLGKTRQLAPRLADRDPLVRASLACRLSEAR